MPSPSDASQPLLQMSGIDKHFAGVAALSGASLAVGRGEVHALIGQNGAGKSTLIKILTGYYARDAGNILFEGNPLEVDSPKCSTSKGNQHDLPGNQSYSVSIGCREYLPGSRISSIRLS